VCVVWEENDQVGVEFLCMAPESLPRRHKLFGDYIATALED